MGVEKLKVEIPKSFSRRSIAAETIEAVRREELIISALEKEKLAKIGRVLEHPALAGLIDGGKITLGIIKPKLDESKGLPRDDDEAANVLIQEIGEEKIVFQLSVVLTPQQAETFYAPNKDKLSRIFNNGKGTVWDSIIRAITAGPLTFLLIYDREGKAVEWWRNKIGKTRPEEADPNSLRGKYALREMLPNNLVHGSESREEVHREVGVFRGVVSSMLQEMEQSELKGKFPEEKILRDIGFLRETERLLSIARIFDSGYKVCLLDKEGNVVIKFLPPEILPSSLGDI